MDFHSFILKKPEKIIPKKLKQDKINISGSLNPAAWVTPARWRDSDGLYIGEDLKNVWLYREVDLTLFKDFSYDFITFLNSFFIELSSQGFNEFHISSVINSEALLLDTEISDNLKNYILADAFYTVPSKYIFLGVKVPYDSNFADYAEDGEILSLKENSFNLISKILGEYVPNSHNLNPRVQILDGIFTKYFLKKMTNITYQYLDFWYQGGRSEPLEVLEEKDFLDNKLKNEKIDFLSFSNNNENVEFFKNWNILDNTNDAKIKLISVRGYLNDYGKLKGVNFNGYQLASNLFTNISALSGVLSDLDTDSFEQINTAGYQYSLLELPHRQLPALDETLPASKAKINPFLNASNATAINHLLTLGFPNIGDKNGILFSLIEPDYQPLWLNTKKINDFKKADRILICGDENSGKTYTSINILIQEFLAGNKVAIFTKVRDEKIIKIIEFLGGISYSIKELFKNELIPSPYLYKDANETQEILATLFKEEVFNNKEKYNISEADIDAINTFLNRKLNDSIDNMESLLSNLEDPRHRKILNNFYRNFPFLYNHNKKTDFKLGSLTYFYLHDESNKNIDSTLNLSDLFIKDKDFSSDEISIFKIFLEMLLEYNSEKIDMVILDGLEEIFNSNYDQKLVGQLFFGKKYDNIAVSLTLKNMDKLVMEKFDFKKLFTIAVLHEVKNINSLAYFFQEYGIPEKEENFTYLQDASSFVNQDNEIVPSRAFIIDRLGKIGKGIVFPLIPEIISILED